MPANNISFPGGNTLLRDICAASYTNADGHSSIPQSYPFDGLPRSKVLKWLWRVKTWHVSFSASVIFTAHILRPGYHVPCSGSWAGSYTNIPIQWLNSADLSVATREFSLLDSNVGFVFPFTGFQMRAGGGCAIPLAGPPSPYFTDNGGDFTGDPGPYPDGSTYDFDFEGTTGDASETVQFLSAPLFWNAANESLQPNISGGGQFRGNLRATQHGGAGDVIDLEATLSMGTGTGTSTTAVLNCDGETAPVSYALFNSSALVLDSHTATVNNITFVPVEFWPYKNRLGQPVYDTATGARLNDPFG